ncbi:MAG: class I SAM-dependent methyltransferase [Geovibrio sp.]|nr:class I SAM-dependent methyltransferase [Geovibrio sp.]
MEFYRILAKAYDEVFPFSQTTFDFLRLHAAGRVLDVGCATGAYVKRFHGEGFSAEGIEYVPELIKYTENISAGDMRRLPESFSGRFSLVYCIGNTLPTAQTLRTQKYPRRICPHPAKRRKGGNPDT